MQLGSLSCCCLEELVALLCWMQRAASVCSQLKGRRGQGQEQEQELQEQELQQEQEQAQEQEGALTLQLQLAPAGWCGLW
jgi:hypothetical protein